MFTILIQLISHNLSGFQIDLDCFPCNWYVVIPKTMEVILLWFCEQVGLDLVNLNVVPPFYLAFYCIIFFSANQL